MQSRLFRFVQVMGLSLTLLPAVPAEAQVGPPGGPCLYTLLDGSTLIDDCPVCDRLPFLEPLRGTFELRLLKEDPLFKQYAVENISFTNTTSTSRKCVITGGGLLQIGGEVAVLQSLTLDLTISYDSGTWRCFFSTNAPLTRLWPMIQVGVEQTNGTLFQQFHLDLNAAPLREIWFSTAEKFEAADKQEISAGDLLSSAGRRVTYNRDLTRHLGITPVVPDLGLKDLDLLPGGEILFSVSEAAWSETLGALRPGDVLSDRGRVVQSNADLLQGLQPVPPSPEGFGLDALQVQPNGETWFSVQQDFFSKALGRTVTSGSLLSDKGLEIRSNAQLLARFGPLNPTEDVGLKAVFVWPGGEIWFTTEYKFEGTNAMLYRAGDLLSDQGYIVFRNAELLSAFGTATALTNMSLDAVWVVTDLLATSEAPVLNAPIRTHEPPGSLLLEWRGTGRVFQLEKATALVGPFVPLTPISPEPSALDPGALSLESPGFYRLRQW